jgi:hypothetical protein
VSSRRASRWTTTPPASTPPPSTRFLSQESYWARGCSRERVERAIAPSARVVGLPVRPPGRPGAGGLPFAGSRWLLHAADAHGLDRRFGFAEPDDPTLVQRPGH